MIGRSMGIDVTWGETSKFAIVITQYRNKKVEARPVAFIVYQVV